MKLTCWRTTLQGVWRAVDKTRIILLLFDHLNDETFYRSLHEAEESSPQKDWGLVIPHIAYHVLWDSVVSYMGWKHGWNMAGNGSGKAMAHGHGESVYRGDA